MLKWNFSHGNNILKRNKEIENSSFILENELQNTLKDFYLIAAMGDNKCFYNYEHRKETICTLTLTYVSAR